MATVEDVVRTAIEQDVVLQAAIARDVVNRRAVARWLEQNREIDAEIDSIYDAVEAYEVDDERWTSRVPWDALENRMVQQFRPVTVFTLDRTRETFQRLDRLFDPSEVPHESDFRIVPTEGAITLLVDEKVAEAALELVGADVVVDKETDLVQIGIMQHAPPPDGGSEDGWVTASIAMAMASAGIDIPYLANGSSGHFIVVREEDEARACRLIQDLSVDPGAEEIDE